MWCTTGPLAFLPLHAAGCYNAAHDPRVYEYVVSSYTPTLTALVESQMRISSSLSESILAVSQPHTPNHSALPGTVTEIKTIQECIENIDFKWLNGEEATVAAVLEEMSKHRWCHFACHGVQHREDPTKSAFALHDGMLDLETMMSKSFKGAELAFLSACQTATGDEKRPEEAIHLAAGMLMAGYRSVVATMWSIGDRDAPLVAKEVYRFLLRTPGMDTGKSVAYALHHAVRQLREEVGENGFVKWVPFIHMGG